MVSWLDRSIDRSINLIYWQSFLLVFLDLSFFFVCYFVSCLFVCLPKMFKCWLNNNKKNNSNYESYLETLMITSFIDFSDLPCRFCFFFWSIIINELIIDFRNVIDDDDEKSVFLSTTTKSGNNKNWWKNFFLENQMPIWWCVQIVFGCLFVCLDVFFRVFLFFSITKWLNQIVWLLLLLLFYLFFFSQSNNQINWLSDVWIVMN